MNSKTIQEWLSTEFIIELNKTFDLTINDLVKTKTSILYNKKVRSELHGNDIHGIYIWSRIDNGEIIYVGMSGKLIWKDDSKTEVEPNSYSVQKRLVSSRGRHKLKGEKDKRELTTYEYLEKIVFNEEGIDKLNISVFKVDTDKYSPTYIESCILHKIFSKEGVIPKYNKSF